jgi:hypothetical protein
MNEIVIEGFKAGTYPQGNFTERELEEISSSYDPANLHEAPIRIGHESDYNANSRVPAYGWISRIIKEGGKLKFVAGQFSDQLKDLVKKGFYKKVSAGFYAPDDEHNPTPGKWRLHHLAFLGAQPPAVKGLQPVSLCEFDANDTPVLVEFADEPALSELSDLATDDTYTEIQERFAQCLTQVEEILNGNIDQDTMSSALSQALYECFDDLQGITNLHFAFLEKQNSILDRLKDKVQEYKEKLTSRKPAGMRALTGRVSDANGGSKEFEERIGALEQLVATFSEENARLKSEQERREQEADHAQHRARIRTFCEEQRIKGNYTKAMDDLGYPEMMFALATSGQVKEFADGRKQSMLDLFQQTISSNRQVTFGAALPEDEQQIADVAKRYIKENGFIDPDQIRKVIFAETYIKKNPGQFKNMNEKQAMSACLTGILQGKIAYGG